MKYINLDKMISLRCSSLVLASTLAATCITGCSNSKLAKCEIPNMHAHVYVNDEGYIRYVESELLEYENYKRSYNYREITKEESKLYRFLDLKDLFRIDENIDLVLAQQEQNQPFTVYEYYSPVQIITPSGLTNYNWTNDPEYDNLTGKEKEVHYIYQAFNLKKDRRGSYSLNPSPLVEDITEVMEEYPYIRTNYFMAVDEYNVDVIFNDDLSKKEQDSKTLKKTVE